MADLPKVAELTALVSFLAPGFIIIGIRNRFKGYGATDVTTNLLLFAVASSAFYAAVAPFFSVPGGISLRPWLWSFLQFFVVPLIVALSWVALDQAEWFYKACSKLGLDVGHHVPTAWDWTFRQKRQPGYVSVELKDGTRYYGTWTERSFASSSAVERDIYLDQAWTVDKDGAWVRLDPPRSLLICSKEINAIELIGVSA